MPRPSRPHKTDRGWRFTFQGRKYRCRTEHEALALLAQIRGDDIDETPVVIGELVAKYQARCPSATAASMLAHLDEWRESKNGPKTVSEITDQSLNEFVAWMMGRRNKRGRRYSNETLRKVILYASGVFKLGSDLGLCPVQKRDFKRPTQQFRPKALTASQVETLLYNLKHTQRGSRVEPLVKFLLETGCRPGEAVKLKFSQIEPGAMAVTIHDHKTQSSTGEPRIIPLNAQAREIIAQQREKHSRCDWIFPNYSGKPYTVGGLRAMLERRGVTPNQLRHTWCQAATAAGMHDRDIQTVMGHVDSKMLRHYRRAASASELAASGALDTLLPELPEPESRVRMAAKRSMSKTGRDRPRSTARSTAMPRDHRKRDRA
jgi:integrase